MQNNFLKQMETGWTMELYVTEEEDLSGFGLYTGFVDNITNINEPLLSEYRKDN